MLFVILFFSTLAIWWFLKSNCLGWIFFIVLVSLLLTFLINQWVYILLFILLSISLSCFYILYLQMKEKKNGKD